MGYAAFVPAGLLQVVAEQVREGHVERVGDPFEVVQAEVAFAAFDCADVCPLHPCGLRQVGLAPAS